MLTRAFLMLFMFLTSFEMSLYASIYCPPDKTIYCYDDRHYTQFTGIPTVFGYPSQLVRYQDTDFLNNCNTGYVQRRWFVDVNQDGTWQSSEGSCIQTIHILGFTQQISVIFPPDKTYKCKDDILNDKPTWVAGPCDVMGFSFKDDVFEVAADACYKIVRNFTVINWCNYHPQSPDWNGQGIWTHKQVIKVVETEAPVFNNCDPLIFNTGQDCKAEIVLSKSAEDNLQCPSQELSWIVEVDLWANGTVDYRYGFNESGEFMIAPVANGTEISIKLPERVGIGKHKIKWSVRDQCGNFRTCNSVFEVKDQKPPTPYMYAFLTSAFKADQMNLMIPARIFDVGSFDNCTQKSKLKFSFSKDINDTLRVVGCNNLGFQFFTVFVTDEAGNSDFAEVFMLVFDNGTCNFGFNFGGRIFRADGRPVQGAVVELKQNDLVVSSVESVEDGSFFLDDVALMEDYYLKIQHHQLAKPEINILDLLHLRDYLFGVKSLENYQFIAADVNQDRKIRANDLQMMRDILLGRITDTQEWQYFSDPGEIKEVNDLQNLRTKTMLMDFDGKFDIIAVFPGDITGTIEPETELRSGLTLISEKSGDSYHLFSDHALKLNGLQMELNLTGEIGAPEIEFAGKKLNPGQFHIDRENGKLRILLSEPFETDNHQAVLSIHNTGSTISLSDIATNMAVGENGTSLRIRLSDSDYRVHNTNAPFSIGNGIIMLNDAELEIKSMYRLDGRQVNFTRYEDNARIQAHQTGIYIIQGVKGAKVLTFKVFVP